MNPAELALKLDRARWWLLSNQPFYGSLSMSLPDVLNNPHGKTACTDATRIYWSPEFLAKLTDEETRFVLMHETQHCAHGHFWRFPKPGKKEQQACDYAINGTLAKIDGAKMPAGGLLSNTFDGLAEEEIANRLPDDPPEGGGQDKNPGDGCGEFTDAPGEGQGQGQDDGKPGQKPGSQPGDGQDSGGDESGAANGQESLKDQWEEKVIQAAQAAKALGRGHIPADMQRLLDRTLAQKIDWRRELADFVKDAMASRNDWARSARRMATAPCIYPRRRRDDVGLILLARDTSGSIDDKLCAEFSELCEQALAETGARGLVIDCDAAIQAEYWIEPGGEVPRKAAGGGGTSFLPPFARAAELTEEGERIAGIIYLTDLQGDFPSPAPDFPTLWLAKGSSDHAPFGRTVKIE